MNSPKFVTTSVLPHVVSPYSATAKMLFYWRLFFKADEKQYLQYKPYIYTSVTMKCGLSD